MDKFLDKVGVDKHKMNELKQIGEIIYSNAQWIFSGIGVALISMLGGKAVVKKVKSKQKAKNQGVNISSDNDINSENILTQTAGNNSNNLNVMGDYHEGLSYKDARQVALDVFKANSSVYTEIAKKTIEERVVNITDDIFTMIYSELPDTVEKLVEPAVQDTLLKIQKEYAKNDDPALKERLIVLLKNRLKADEKDMETIVLDEALEIVPKLTSIQLNILSLHLTVLRILHHEVTNRDTFFNMLTSKILVFYSDHMNKTMEYAHLQYLGCAGILSEGGTYKPIEEIFRNRYAGLFSRGFNKEEFYEYMGIEIQEFQQLITTCQIDREKYQFNAMNEDVLRYSIAQSGKQEYEEKLLQYYKEHIMEIQEIKEDISSNVQGFEELANFWKKTSEFKSMNLTSVGIEIGLLNYNLQTGSEIQWKDFM